jgi:hypothetical protein
MEKPSIVLTTGGMINEKSNPNIHSSKVTHRLYAKALGLLEQYPEGLRWSELLSKIKTSDRTPFTPRQLTDVSGKLSKDFLTRSKNHPKGIFVC